MANTPGTRTREPLATAHEGPAIIAHRAGNSRKLVRAALADSPDFLEVDLWLHRGRFEARHERAAYPLPLLVEKWYLSFVPRHPFSLHDLLVEAGPTTGIFLDLKNGAGQAAALVRRSLDSAPGHPRVAASAQQWALLRALRAVCPEVDCLYSIDVLAKLDLFLSIADRDAIPHGVSCKHTLLSRPVVEQLHARGFAVVAWTVNDLDRARELTSWGVDGITTERVAEVRTALKIPAPATT